MSITGAKIVALSVAQGAEMFDLNPAPVADFVDLRTNHCSCASSASLGVLYPVRNNQNSILQVVVGDELLRGAVCDVCTSRESLQCSAYFKVEGGCGVCFQNFSYVFASELQVILDTVYGHNKFFWIQRARVDPCLNSVKDHLPVLGPQSESVGYLMRQHKGRAGCICAMQLCLLYRLCRGFAHRLYLFAAGCDHENTACQTKRASKDGFPLESCPLAAEFIGQWTACAVDKQEQRAYRRHQRDRYQGDASPLFDVFQGSALRLSVCVMVGVAFCQCSVKAAFCHVSNYKGAGKRISESVQRRVASHHVSGTCRQLRLVLGQSCPHVAMGDTDRIDRAEKNADRGYNRCRHIERFFAFRFAKCNASSYGKSNNGVCVRASCRVTENESSCTFGRYRSRPANYKNGGIYRRRGKQCGPSKWCRSGNISYHGSSPRLWLIKNHDAEVVLSSKEIAQCARYDEIFALTRTKDFAFRASLLPSPRWKCMDMRKRKSSTLLTARRRRRMVWPINGKNPLWGRRNPLFLTVSRHVSCGYFCARILGAISRFGREGGEYKTLRGNKPACLRTGFEPPATSAVVENLIGGVVKRRPEGFDMTDNVSGRNPSAASQITLDIAAMRGLSRAERAAINRRATAVATMLFPYVRDYMLRGATERLRTSDKLRISALPIPPDVGLMIARYRTFGVDGFDPRDPAAHRQVCSVGAAMTLIEAIKSLREIADGLSPENPQRAKVATVVSCLLSIEIDAGVLV